MAILNYRKMKVTAAFHKRLQYIWAPSSNLQSGIRDSEFQIAMLYSMTGFGRATGAAGTRQVAVEIKSLNGKGFEMATKLPSLLRAWELDVRALLSATLLRGTTDISISITQNGLSKPLVANVDLAKFYYNSMQQIAGAIGVPVEDALAIIMRMPEVIATEGDALGADEWADVKEVIAAAAAHLMQHRKDEGASLEKDLRSRIDNIGAALQKILPLEGPRGERIRERLRTAMQELSVEQVDGNRFEQELIYYIEKIDFSEEKTRLAQHLSYFREVLDKADMSKGKVLGFILQEIGREINTLGSKASDAVIQQIVVGMKDELEKAKEQVLNVL